MFDFIRTNLLPRPGCIQPLDCDCILSHVVSLPHARLVSPLIHLHTIPGLDLWQVGAGLHDLCIAHPFRKVVGYGLWVHVSEYGLG